MRQQLTQDISARRFLPEFDCELPADVTAELRRPGTATWVWMVPSGAKAASWVDP